MTVYKIKSRTSGMYSMGGTLLQFGSRIGKTWSGEGPLKLHLNLIEDCARGNHPSSVNARKYLNDMVIEEYTLVNTATTTYEEFIRNSRRTNKGKLNESNIT